MNIAAEPEVYIAWMSRQNFSEAETLRNEKYCQTPTLASRSVRADPKPYPIFRQICGSGGTVKDLPQQPSAVYSAEL